MKDIVIRLLITGGIMGALDALWLGVIANKLYKSQIGSLLLEKPQMTAVILLYIIYAIGIVVFVVNPALAKQSWTHAAGCGALFGFVVYGVYDLTNLATLKGFTLKFALIDLAWGTFLTATVSILVYLVAQKWLS